MARNSQANYQAMRQLNAGVYGYAFLGQPGESQAPVAQGVFSMRRLDVFQRSPGAVSLNRPQISRVVAGNIITTPNLQPLTSFNQGSRTFKVPGSGG